jgi:hypothetical protein
VVEGPRFVTGQDDETKHRIQILQDVAGSDPKDAESGGLQQLVSLQVAFWVASHQVGFAVDFNRHSLLQTGEIQNKAHVRELTSEAIAAGPSSQLLPKQNFRKCHLATKLAGETHVFVRSANRSMLHTPPILPGTGRWQPVRADGGVGFGAVDPSTMLRMVPLPVPGRI